MTRISNHSRPSLAISYRCYRLEWDCGTVARPVVHRRCDHILLPVEGPWTMPDQRAAQTLVGLFAVLSCASAVPTEQTAAWLGKYDGMRSAACSPSSALPSE
jgi:hypothetical protein